MDSAVPARVIGLPGPPPAFGDPSYWEGEYATAGVGAGDETYEWLLGWDHLSWLLEPLLARDTTRSVLHLGCGNSALPEDMHEAGYTKQTAVDISDAVISRMARRNTAREGMRWITADVTDLTNVLPSDEFALVTDKSTMDALFCHDDHALMITKFVKEAFRLAAPTGVYVCVSMHKPGAVLPWLRQRAFNWRVRVVEIPDDSSAAARGPPQQPLRLHLRQARACSGLAGAALARSLGTRDQQAGLGPE